MTLRSNRAPANSGESRSYSSFVMKAHAGSLAKAATTVLITSDRSAEDARRITGADAISLHLVDVHLKPSPSVAVSAASRGGSTSSPAAHQVHDGRDHGQGADGDPPAAAERCDQ